MRHFAFCARHRARVVLLSFLGLLLTAPLWAVQRNVILMIGDGMGPDIVNATGAYLYGKDYHRFGGTKRLALETLAFQAYATTFPATQNAGYDPTWAGGNREYIKANATDSAAAATALACGVKTYNAAIGVDLNKLPVESIVEIAQRRGMLTGVITSVSFCHATPAGFAAHDDNRNHYTAIAHDMIFDVKPTVIMGAGHPDFGPKDKPYTCISQQDWEAVRAGKSGYRLIEAREDFVKLATDPGTEPVLGLFRAQGCLAYRKANGKSANPALPTLAEMTRGALRVLDNPEGFFLMVEGGSIDSGGHANNLDVAIGETIAFDEAVADVVTWIKAHGGWERNLLIITADHDTGYLNSVVPANAGELPTVKWGTDGKWGGHTNRPVYAYYQGAGSVALTAHLRRTTDFERGEIRYLDNIEIFAGMDAALRTAKTQAPEGWLAPAR